MRIINLIVAIAFVLSGVMLAFGYLTSNGAISGFATYIGVPLIAYSTIAFIISLVVYLIKRQGLYWDTLYPLNLGFSLIAYSSFDFVPKYLPLGVLIAILIGIVLGTVLRKTNFRDLYFSPIIVVAASILVAIPIIKPYWSLWFLSISICLIVLTSYKGKNSIRTV